MIDLKIQYGKKYRVTPCQCEGEHPGDSAMWYEIVGKRGYIRLWGANELEIYISSSILEKRIERNYPAFKPKNHYDDATAFVFADKPELVASACKWVKARNKRKITPEGLERLKHMREQLRNRP